MLIHEMQRLLDQGNYHAPMHCRSSVSQRPLGWCTTAFCSWTVLAITTMQKCVTLAPLAIAIETILAHRPALLKFCRVPLRRQRVIPPPQQSPRAASSLGDSVDTGAVLAWRIWCLACRGACVAPTSSAHQVLVFLCATKEGRACVKEESAFPPCLPIPNSSLWEDNRRYQSSPCSGTGQGGVPSVHSPVGRQGFFG